MATTAVSLSLPPSLLPSCSHPFSLQRKFLNFLSSICLDALFVQQSGFWCFSILTGRAVKENEGERRLPVQNRVAICHHWEQRVTFFMMWKKIHSPWPQCLQRCPEFLSYSPWRFIIDKSKRQKQHLLPYTAKLFIIPCFVINLHAVGQV